MNEGINLVLKKRTMKSHKKALTIDIRCDNVSIVRYAPLAQQVEHMIVNRGYICDTSIR